MRPSLSAKRRLQSAVRDFHFDTLKVKRQDFVVSTVVDFECSSTVGFTNLTVMPNFQAPIARTSSSSPNLPHPIMVQVKDYEEDWRQSGSYTEH